MKTNSKKKMFNIAIIVLAVILAGCVLMAVGSMKGWFGGNDQSQETFQTQEVTQETQSGDQDNDGANKDGEAAENNEAEAADTEEADSNGSDSGNASADVKTCTITIKCNDILKHMDDLKSGKNKYVPSNGVILSTSTVQFRDGDTAFDVTKRACSAAGIPLAYKGSSMGKYVQGINNLFEFDCGGSSGWLYSVNGTEPNHASSAHKLKNGDKIVWHYTCGK